MCSVGRLERNCAVLVCSEVTDGSCPQARRDSHFWASHISAITQGLKWRDECSMLSPLHTALKIPGLWLGKGEEYERQKKGAGEEI